MLFGIGNAIITKADIIMEEPFGGNGLNTIINLGFKVEGGTHILRCHFNPLKISSILETLEIEKFSELIGTPVKIDYSEEKDKVTRITNFLNDDDKENWINTDTGVYFGSNLKNIVNIEF